jgi:hypothetical protein
VRRAVRDGLIERPDDDAYVTGLVFGLETEGVWGDLDSTYRSLLFDPDLLEEVWHLFEIDAGAELSRATTYEQTDTDREWPSFTRGENRWLYALTRLSEEGLLDRQRLLDASLDALMRDFRASTVGWYATLHEELAPMREERIARIDRYLALVTSPTPAVVKEGLAALRAIEDAVDARAFARVAPTPFAQRQKNLAVETLSMLARLAKRDEDARPVLLEAAPGRLRLEARGAETGDAETALPAALEGEPQAVVLNTRLLADLLDAVGGERLELRWTSPQAPVVIREAEREEGADLWVVMPLYDPALSRRQAQAA